MPAVLALAAALLATPPARAETTVRGTVQTADGAMVVGASVWVFGSRAPNDSSIAATTDGEGAFRFSLPLGPTSELLVRRRGFVDARVSLGADAATKRSLALPAVTLKPASPPLLRVEVPDTGAYTGLAGPYFRRLAQRRGDFITRGEILRLRPTRMSALLRTMPGVSVETGMGGSSFVRVRGRRCYASLWIDGANIAAGRAFDVDGISPMSLMGVEVFSLFSGLPIEYQSNEGSACGVVALWTRRGVDVWEDAMIPSSVADPSSVRLASEVDAPARVAEGATFAPVYSAPARAEGVAGTVLVELVVDTSGAVERGTVGVVAASSPELVDGVLRAASRLRFEPARHGGRPVRQLVQLAAEFRTTKKRS